MIYIVVKTRNISLNNGIAEIIRIVQPRKIARFAIALSLVW